MKKTIRAGNSSNRNKIIRANTGSPEELIGEIQNRISELGGNGSVQSATSPIEWDDSDLNYTDIPEDISRLTDPDGYIDTIGAGMAVGPTL